MTDQTAYRHYPILWVETRVVFQARRQGWLGICGYSQRVCKTTSIQDLLTPLIMTDLIVRDERCEEGERCVCWDCPLNRTTRKSYARAMEMTPAQAKRLPDLFETREPVDWNASPDGLKAFRDLLEQHPRGGLVTQTCKNPRRRRTNALAKQ